MMDTTETITKGLDFDTHVSVWGFRGKNYLLAIGIDKYKHWTPLEGPVKEVEDFIKILLGRYQFQRDNMITIKNRAATKRKIWDELNKLAGKITSDDNLIIYFSGHGHYNRTTKAGFLIPVNAPLGDETKYLHMATIADILQNVDSLHTLLILDACFSGTIIKQITQNRGAPGDEAFKSRTVFTSGRDEVVQDNSLFAEGILQTLTRNGDPHLRAAKLILEVKDYMQQRGANQTPLNSVLLNSGDKGGDFIFHLQVQEAELWSKTLKEHSADGYKRFMDSFPDSKHFKQAREACDWCNVLTEDHIPIFQRYINTYGTKGTFFNEAIKRQRELECNTRWEEIRKQDMLSGYNYFISICPESQFVEVAKQRIQEKGGIPKVLAGPDPISPEDKEWEAAQQENTFKGYLNFTRRFPRGKFLVQANLEIVKMEDSAFNDIRHLQASDTYSLEHKIEKCLQYFNDYPGGKYTDKVKIIKDELEIEKSNENP